MYNSKAYKAKNIVIGLISTVCKLAICIFFAFPFYWMLTTSFKTYTESIRFPPTLIPKVFTLEGYRTVFEGLNLWMYLKNSLIIIACVVAIQMIVMVPAAYGFSKCSFKGKGVLFGFVVVAFMIPGQITFVTTFLMFSKMQLIKTLIPQILPFGANAFGIFLLRQNFMQVPDELLESARLDEANVVQIMVRIMLPMAKSSMVTIMLLSFIGQWNSYFWPLVMTTTDAVRPFTLAIDRLKDLEFGIIWPTIMAGNMLMIMPVLILFLVGSKKIIAAMAYRGIK